MSAMTDRRDEEAAALVAVLAALGRRRPDDRLTRWRTDRRAALARTGHSVGSRGGEQRGWGR